MWRQELDDTAALAILNASENEIREFSNYVLRNPIWCLVDRLQEYFGGKIVTEPIENASVGEGFALTSQARGSLQTRQ